MDPQTGDWVGLLGPGSHGRARLNGAHLGDHRTKQVQVLVKVEDIDRDPLVDIYISGRHKRISNNAIGHEIGAYLGRATIVLNLPVTSAARTNGWHK